MNIQAEKLNVLQPIINSDEVNLIKDIKSLITSETLIGLMASVKLNRMMNPTGYINLITAIFLVMERPKPDLVKKNVRRLLQFVIASLKQLNLAVYALFLY